MRRRATRSRWWSTGTSWISCGASVLIEIQTRGFAGMRAKVLALLAAGHRVRVVHPIAVDRWIVQVDDDGGLLGRRRSPRHGDLVDLAAELVTFPELLDDPGFEIEVLLTREEEVRRHDPKRCWRRHGWTVVERRLIDVLDRVTLARPGDLVCLAPRYACGAVHDGRAGRRAPSAPTHRAAVDILLASARPHRGDRHAGPLGRVSPASHGRLRAS